MENWIKFEKEWKQREKKRKPATGRKYKIIVNTINKIWFLSYFSFLCGVNWSLVLFKYTSIAGPRLHLHPCSRRLFFRPLFHCHIHCDLLLSCCVLFWFWKWKIIVLPWWCQLNYTYQCAVTAVLSHTLFMLLSKIKLTTIQLFKDWLDFMHKIVYLMVTTLVTEHRLINKI